MNKPVQLGGSYQVAKASVPDQNIFGWFSVGALADGEAIIDADGDIIPVEELAKAAHEFTKAARGSGEEHDGGVADGELITSITFSDDILDAMSVDPVTGDVIKPLRKALHEHMPRGWFGGFHIPDAEAFERSRTEKTEFSIEGTANSAEVV